MGPVTTSPRASHARSTRASLARAARGVAHCLQSLYVSTRQRGSNASTGGLTAARTASSAAWAT
jgi:hypothetical protein